jgi:hypothetical protein
MKKLVLSILITSSLNSFAQCTELFFSEYVEGSGNNKAIEIYNPTNVSVNLSTYVFARYSNGNGSISDQTTLSGTIAPFDVVVLANGQTTGDSTSPPCDPALQALADLLDHAYPAPTYMNGNDALALIKSGTTVDIFGKIGEDPVTAWTDVYPYTTAGGGQWITKDHTMIRNRDVKQGVTLSPPAFNPFAEYDTLPENTWTQLGRHTCDCGTIGIIENDLPTVAVYPNPSISNQQITVSSSAEISAVEIYNLQGQKVKEITYSTRSKTARINISDLSKNIYFITTYTLGRLPSTVKLTLL